MTCFIVLLFLGEVFSSKIEILKYIDELLCIISILYIFLQIFVKKYIKKRDIIILTLLGIIVLLGIFGNITRNIQKNWFYILVDIISTIKCLTIYIFIKYYLTPKSSQIIIRNFFYISKFLILISTVFALVSQFINLKMTGEIRYGIKGYFFIFGMQHVLAIYIMSALLFIYANEKNTRKQKFYTILAFFNEFMTTKGPSIIWCFLVILFLKYFYRKEKVSKKIVILIAIVSVLLGQYQINTYFKNVDAPRALLLKYGIITGNNYFPIGAGFASYGSEMARYDYSKLYIKYGFNNYYGMSTDYGAFLNDNYWPMLIGQTGYFATGFMLIIYYIIFKGLQEKNKNNKVKAILLSNYIYIIIHSLGSAAITSSTGVFIFIIFAIFEKQFIIDQGKEMKDESMFN